MPKSTRITSFNLPAGRMIGGKYRVVAKLGGGWEGEVYKVVESRTGATRAAKLFFPHRNEKDKAVTIYARKLERLRRCRIVIQYHHSETIRHQKQPITCLISEFVEGELLARFIERQPRKRLSSFEALHLVYALARGLEEIHAAREYHGDIHDGNVMVRRVGIGFEVKLVDFYNWGRPTAAHYRDDVIFLMRLLYDAVGGARAYRKQPAEIKRLILGLRGDLIGRAFPTARHLRQHLESFEW
jgi:hypothetical protein